MRNVLLGTLGGLLVGTLCALAYNDFFGDGAQVANLQAQLDEANASLAAAKKAHITSARSTSTVADQIADLASKNADLEKQVADLKASGPASAPGEITPTLLAETLRGMIRGGAGMMGQQRMLLLKTRLKLTPDQEAKIKAAMDADGKARRDVMRQWFQKGKLDPATAASANTLDATLKNTLTASQMADYQKVQADEKTSRADSMANMQVNSMVPLLQLSDAQKEQVYNQLYQAQSSAADPMTMMTDPNALKQLATQTAATQAALSKALSPDQYALYQQQVQAGGFGAGFPGGPGGFGNRQRGGNGGGNNGGGNVAAPAPTAAPATTAAPAVTATASGTAAASTTTSTTTPVAQ